MPADTLSQVNRNQVAGVLAAFFAVIVWAGWIVGTRYAVDGGQAGARLSPADIGLLRYGVPALLLVGYWWPLLRRPGGRMLIGLKPATLGWGQAAALFAWGTPFILLAGEGLKIGPAAVMAALVPGTMPLMAALIGWLVLGERLTGARQAGLVCIGAAVVLLLGASLWAGDARTLQSAPYFLAASLCWAVATVAFRRAGLTALQSAGLVAVWSLLILAPICVWQGSNLFAIRAGELAAQILGQGLINGVLAVAAFNFALVALGARGTSFLALVPVLAALMAAVLIGEPLGLRTALAIGLASLGVALLNGVWDRGWPGRNGPHRPRRLP